MVLCLVVSFSKGTGRDKDVSFYRLPRVITSREKHEYELSKKRRAGFLAAKSRDDLPNTKLENWTIGIVRQKYSILQSTLPIDFVIKLIGEECPLSDRNV